MAIKGKSKPKGGGKAPARGPKPAYVPVRKPLLQRRAFWLPVLVVLGVATIAGLWYGIAKQRTADREEALAQDLSEAATAYRERVDPILATVGQPVPPNAYEVLPAFTAALTDFVDGKAKGSDLEAVASGVVEQAAAAATQLEAIDAVELVADKGFDEATVVYVLNSRSRLTQAMRVYEQAGRLAQEAAVASGRQAEVLAEQASAIAGVAKDIFDDGYQDFVEFQFRAGTFQPGIPTP